MAPRVSSSVDQAARRNIALARRRLMEIESRNLSLEQTRIHDISNSLALVEKVQQHRAGAGVGTATTLFATTDPLAAVQMRQAIQAKEETCIHDHYCGCSAGMKSPDCYANRHVRFRVVRQEGSLGPEFIQGPRSLQRLCQHIRDDLHSTKRVTVGNGTTSAMENYVVVTKRTLALRKKAFDEIDKEKRELLMRIEILSKAPSPEKALSAGSVKQEDDIFAKTHGSKSAALVRFLQSVVDAGEKVIVFSYWHDTLQLIERTLAKRGLKSVFCRGSGSNMAEALESFSTGSVPIILLSAKSKASGANLQCATHVALLDPAGSSPEHGSTLEEQAVGRAVRMGQERPVTITRFRVLGTIEEQLFKEIDKAAEKAKKRASDSSYVIQDSHRALPKRETRVVVEEGNDIKVTATITGEERICREFLEAEARGNIIDMVDWDDEENVLPQTNRPLVATPSAGGNIAVKRESASNTKDRVDDSRTPKRARTKESTPSSFSAGVLQESMESQDATVTPPADEIKNRVAKVRGFLRRLDLEECEDKVISSGYDSLAWLYNFANNADIMGQLSATVGFKPGHAVRFQVGLVEEAKRATTSRCV